MKKSILLLFVVFVSLTSCKKIIDSTDAIFNDEDLNIEDLKEYKVKEMYAISVPNYMKELKSLNDDASFEYANVYKENYIIVIDENKQEFIDALTEVEMYNDTKTPLENYADIQLQTFSQNVSGIEIKQLKSQLKNLDSQQYQFFGNVGETDVAYVINFIESEENMFMIMSWTLKEEYEKYKNTILLTQSTFKTL